MGLFWWLIQLAGGVLIIFGIVVLWLRDTFPAVERLRRRLAEIYGIDNIGAWSVMAGVMMWLIATVVTHWY